MDPGRSFIVNKGRLLFLFLPLTTQHWAEAGCLNISILLTPRLKAGCKQQHVRIRATRLWRGVVWIGDWMGIRWIGRAPLTGLLHR
jgi:hypothetical protein